MANKLISNQIGTPCIKLGKSRAKTVDQTENQDSIFEHLDSHARAMEALNFGIKLRGKNTHIYVIGDDYTAKMHMVKNFYKKKIKNFANPRDWVYVNNFSNAYQPIPLPLPSGQAKQFHADMKKFIYEIHGLLNRTLINKNLAHKIDEIHVTAQQQIDIQAKKLQDEAAKNGFTLVAGEEGYVIETLEGAENSAQNYETYQKLLKALTHLSHDANNILEKANKLIIELRNDVAKNALSSVFQKYKDKFLHIPKRWLESLRKDVIENLDRFIDFDSPKKEISHEVLNYYGVCILVCHEPDEPAPVVVAANPTFEDFFGKIKYRSHPETGNLETDVTLIEPGLVHKANGGILIVRADVLIKDPMLWQSLKTALRDQELSIREHYREGGIPLADAPRPRPIPLDFQVCITMSPENYFSFFLEDKDFHQYFKIRAEIGESNPITESNLRCYREYFDYIQKSVTKKKITAEAMNYLVAYTSRWLGNRDRLSSKIELLKDIIIAAEIIANDNSTTKIDKKILEKLFQKNHYLKAYYQEEMMHAFQNQQVLIDVKGKRIGCVNGLTVLNLGDRSIGLPSLISAQTYASRKGVVNIERMIGMSGPIQEKGSYILEGFLKGTFGQKFALSCGCSLTFEQNYTPVDGDSATMAELVAIISSLAELPVKQNIAITGSMNQFGIAQVVGGVHLKIEGFYNLCKARGLNGEQGVIIPAANQAHVTVKNEVRDAIHKKKFHIYTVNNIFEALELLLEKPMGVHYDDHGRVISTELRKTIYQLVCEKLKNFHTSMP